MALITDMPQASILADEGAAARGETRMLRNIVISPEPPADGEGAEGDVWIVYGESGAEGA